MSGIDGLAITQNGSDAVITFNGAAGSIALAGVNASLLLQNAQHDLVFN